MESAVHYHTECGSSACQDRRAHRTKTDVDEYVARHGINGLTFGYCSGADCLRFSPRGPAQPCRQLVVRATSQLI